MHYFREIPQNYHTFASSLIPPKQNGSHLMMPVKPSNVFPQHKHDLLGQAGQRKAQLMKEDV